MTFNRTNIGLRAKNRGQIYESIAPSYEEALDQALKDNIDLTGIDFSGQDLRGITLDGITLSHANFIDCDLTDANLSEASFENCDFSGANLIDACFCYSRLDGCTFQDNHFHNTDFSQAEIENCIFSGLTTFSINFYPAASLKNTKFLQDKKVLEMTLSPCVIRGFRHPIIILDQNIIIDEAVFDFDRGNLDHFFSILSNS